MCPASAFINSGKNVRLRDRRRQPAIFEGLFPLLPGVGEQAAATTDAGVVDHNGSLSVGLLSISSSRNRLRWSSIATSALWVVDRSPCAALRPRTAALVSVPPNTYRPAGGDVAHRDVASFGTSWRASSGPSLPPPGDIRQSLRQNRSLGIDHLS